MRDWLLLGAGYMIGIIQTLGMILFLKGWEWASKGVERGK